MGVKKMKEECKLSGCCNINTNNKSNINLDITSTTHPIVLPDKGKGETGQTILESMNKGYKLNLALKPCYIELLKSYACTFI